MRLGLHDPNKEGKRHTYLFDLDEIDEWLESHKAPGRTTRIPEIELA